MDLEELGDSCLLFACPRPLRFLSLQGPCVLVPFQEASKGQGHWPSGLVWPSLFRLWSCCDSKRRWSSPQSPRLGRGGAGLTNPMLEVPPWNKDEMWGSPLIQPHNPSALCTGPLCAFWPSLLPGQEIKADTKFVVEYFHKEWDVDEQFLHCSLYNREFCWDRASMAPLPFFIYPDGELVLFSVSFPPQGCAVSWV